MSFVYDHDSNTKTPRKGKRKKEKYLLQAAGHRMRKERALSFASKLPASLTIEAALALPLFLLFVVGVASFLLLFSLQISVQNGMDETARSLTRKAYLAERTELSGFAMGQPAMELALHKEPLRTVFAQPHLHNVSSFFSTYESDTGILDLVVSYDYALPGFPDRLPDLHLAQRTRCRAWIGRALDTCGDDPAAAAKETDGDTVYVAENGTVYHTSKDCHYLDLSVHTVSGAEVEHLRNKGGSRYGSCPLCAKNRTPEDAVYVTDYGENWHTSLSCSGLKRTVTEKKRSEVGDLPLCSKCGRRH